VSILSSCRKIRFKLPKKGILEPNAPDDPLLYYYHPLVGFLYRNRIKRGLSLLKPHYESILEVGFGSGILMPTLFSIGKSVSGIDTVSDPIKVTKNLEKIGVHANLTQGDICYSKYPQESFDLVVAISILEHVREVEKLINKIFNILRPGGHFLAGMPNVNNFMKIAFSLIGYHNIQAHHITGHRRFLKLASEHFKLEGFNTMPSWSNETTGLYFNMLLSKAKDRSNKICPCGAET